jgi:hypothetical protein
MGPRHLQLARDAIGLQLPGPGARRTDTRSARFRPHAPSCPEKDYDGSGKPANMAEVLFRKGLSTTIAALI